MSRPHYSDPYPCPDCGQFVYDDMQARRHNLGGYGQHEHQRAEAQRVVARHYIAKTTEQALDAQPATPTPKFDPRKPFTVREEPGQPATPEKPTHCPTPPSPEN